MRSIRRNVLAAVLFVAAIASMAFAQGPLHKRINYTINVPYALRMGNYMLPPGQYVLYQISANDTNLFALYQNDMTRSPVAMIRTVRIDYQGSDYPEKTKILLDIDESSRDLHPVLQGWTIPGEDGWEVIAVVPKNRRAMTRVR